MPKDHIEHRASAGFVTQVALVLAGTALLALSARVQIPFWPVPMTLQTLAVLMIGAAYGARLGGATLLAYLAEGAVGFPVFASGAGLAYMAGPTGGYLLGFLLAAVFVGYAADRGWLKRLVPAVAVMLGGGMLIYAPGVAWLSGLIGMQKAVAGGLLPFLPAEAFKLALAALLSLAVARRGAR
jgi:biotin transport system substrate-specific component